MQGRVPVTEPALSGPYREYIACLNKQDWSALIRFLHDDVRHNGRALGLAGYRAMLEADSTPFRTSIFGLKSLSPMPPMWRAVCGSTARQEPCFSTCRSTASGYPSARTLLTNFVTGRSPKSGRSSTRPRSRPSSSERAMRRPSFAFDL